MRIPLFLVAAAFVLPTPSSASSFSVDISDLWWNSSESGWGVNLIQEADIAVATLFVYGGDGRAHWYIAPDMQGAHGSSLDTATFAGSLYETSGPAFGASFNPSAVSARQAGTMSFTLENPTTAHLTYSVDGVTVSKTVARQTWRTNDINGRYIGTRAYRGFHCAPDNPVTQNLGLMTVSQAGNTLSIVTTGGNPSCTFTGDYSQSGRLGQSSGSFNCGDGMSGTYRMQEIEVGQHAISARLDGTAQSCQFRGHLGGARADVDLPPD